MVHLESNVLSHRPEAKGTTALMHSMNCKVMLFWRLSRCLLISPIFQVVYPSQITRGHEAMKFLLPAYAIVKRSLKLHRHETRSLLPRISVASCFMLKSKRKRVIRWAFRQRLMIMPSTTSMITDLTQAREMHLVDFHLEALARITTLVRWNSLIKLVLRTLDPPAQVLPMATR